MTFIKKAGAIMGIVKRTVCLVLCMALACGFAWADSESDLKTETNNLYDMLNFFGLDDMLYSEAESIENKLLSGELSHTFGDVSRFYKLYFKLLSYKNASDETDAALLRYLDLLRAFLAQNPFEKLVTTDRSIILGLYDDLTYQLYTTTADDAAFAETFEALRGYYSEFLIYYNEFLMNYEEYADFYEADAQLCLIGTILCEFYSKVLSGGSKDDAFKTLEAEDRVDSLFERGIYEAYSQNAQMCLKIYRGDIDGAGLILDNNIEFARENAPLYDADEDMMIDKSVTLIMQFLYAMRIRNVISDDGILSMIDAAKNKPYLEVLEASDAGTDNGFRAGDRIVCVNETRIYASEQLARVKESLSDQKGEVTLLRDGETVKVEIDHIGEMWGISMRYKTEKV